MRRWSTVSDPRDEMEALLRSIELEGEVRARRRALGLPVEEEQEAADLNNAKTQVDVSLVFKS